MRKYSEDDPGVFLKLSFYWQAKKKKSLIAVVKEKKVLLWNHIYFLRTLTNSEILIL